MKVIEEWNESKATIEWMLQEKEEEVWHLVNRWAQREDEYQAALNQKDSGAAEVTASKDAELKTKDAKISELDDSLTEVKDKLE